MKNSFDAWREARQEKIENEVSRRAMLMKFTAFTGAAILGGSLYYIEKKEKEAYARELAGKIDEFFKKTTGDSVRTFGDGTEILLCIEMLPVHIDASGKNPDSAIQRECLAALSSAMQQEMGWNVKDIYMDSSTYHNPEQLTSDTLVHSVRSTRDQLHKKGVVLGTYYDDLDMRYTRYALDAIAMQPSCVTCDRDGELPLRVMARPENDASQFLTVYKDLKEKGVPQSEIPMLALVQVHPEQVLNALRDTHGESMAKNAVD